LQISKDRKVSVSLQISLPGDWSQRNVDSKKTKHESFLNEIFI